MLSTHPLVRWEIHRAPGGKCWLRQCRRPSLCHWCSRPYSGGTASHPQISAWDCDMMMKQLARGDNLLTCTGRCRCHTSWSRTCTSRRGRHRGSRATGCRHCSGQSWSRRYWQQLQVLKLFIQSIIIFKIFLSTYTDSRLRMMRHRPRWAPPRPSCTRPRCSKSRSPRCWWCTPRSGTWRFGKHWRLKNAR